MGLLVCMAHCATACLSGVIASLFMVACRQQGLISALNGAASDSRSKCSCSASLILHLLTSGGGERGWGLLGRDSGQLNAPVLS